MGIAERKLRHREEMRSNILSAAWTLVLAEGWSALSIRKIADAIEYSIPVIYSHFENKDAILLEFTREGFTLLAQQVSEAKKQAGQAHQQLETIAQAYWNFAFNNPEYYQLMFGLGIPTCETVNSVVEVKNFTDVVMQTIKEAIAQSQRPATDHWLKFRTYWSILHGLVSIQMIRPHAMSDPSNQLVLEDAVAGFIRSI